MQVFILTVELAIPAGTSSKEAKRKKETYPVTLEAKLSKCSI